MTSPDVLPPRVFPLGAVLTITAGSYERPFCTLADLYSILGWLRHDVPAADELADAIDDWRPVILAQHPELAAVVAPPADASDTAVLSWLADQEAQFGAYLQLTSPGPRQ